MDDKKKDPEKAVDRALPSLDDVMHCTSDVMGGIKDQKMKVKIIARGRSETLILERLAPHTWSISLSPAMNSLGICRFGGIETCTN